MANYAPYFDWLMEPLGKSSADLMEGCASECDGPDDWPESRAVTYAYLVLAIYALVQVVGEVPAITSGYRCDSCNRRRGGAARSRHLAGTSGGLPYGAVDIQWRPGVLESSGLAFRLREIPDYIRRYTGLDVGVGVIMYRGRRRLHLDFRERDYIDDQTI